jgi:tetratricopeptide (TPR) repeat protein
VEALLAARQPEAAVRLVEDAERRQAVSWAWPLAERLGRTYLHLGRPADARRVWQLARSAPSEALRECRLAAAFWVERDFESAAHHYRAALDADPRQSEACWGLAHLYTQLGQADAGLEACRQGLRLLLTNSQRDELRNLLTLLERCASGGQKQPGSPR